MWTASPPSPSHLHADHASGLEGWECLRRGGQLAPIEPDRESPVLLMGDSHTLVFHDPALYARGAGLPDQRRSGSGSRST